MKNFSKKFNGRMMALVGLMLFAVTSMVTFSVIPMESFVDVVSGISVAGVLPLFSFYRSPDANDGGGEAQLIEKIKSEVGKKFADLVDANVDFKELKALKKQIEESKTTEQLETLKTQIEELGLSIKAMKESGEKNQAPKSIRGMIYEAIEKAQKSGEMAKLKTSRSASVDLSFKAPATMTTANVTPTTPGGVVLSLTDFDSAITPIVRRNPFIMQLVNVGRTNSKNVAWVEQANADPGSAGNTAEGSLKTQGDFDLIERQKPVEKMTYFIKVSKEMLDDMAVIENEINNELMTLLTLRLDQQILNGTGAGNQLLGIINSGIPAFAAGPFATAIQDANIFDVIRVAVSQIESANPDGPFMPNFIVMHPQDVAKMELSKGSDGHYTIPPFATLNGREVSGLRVVANIGVAQDQYVVGDFTKSNVKIREDVTITMGHENDDFTKNLVTILGEVRAVHYIKSNHLKAFVLGDFTTDIAAILAP